MFERAFYPYLNTVTCAGHATIGTGTFPYEHGIIMNEWYQRAARRRMSCTDDPHGQEPALHASGRADWHSARRLRVPTLGDRLRATSPASRVVTLSMKPRSTVMLAGHGGTAVTWFADSNVWATSTAFTPALLPEVQSVRRRQSGRAIPGRGLGASASGRGGLPAETTKARTSARAPGGRSPFPHPLAGAAGHGRRRGSSTSGSAALSPTRISAGMAAHLVAHYQLGQRDAVDYLGHQFLRRSTTSATTSVPNRTKCRTRCCDWIGTLGELFAGLDQTVGRDRYVVGLSADHGVARIPEAVRAEGGDAGRVVNPEVMKVAEAAMTAAHGAGPHVALVEYTNLYLTNAARARAREGSVASSSRSSTPCRRCRASARASRAAVWKPSEPAPTRSSEPPRLSYHPEESGDVDGDPQAELDWHEHLDGHARIVHSPTISTCPSCFSERRSSRGATRRRPRRPIWRQRSPRSSSWRMPGVDGEVLTDGAAAQHSTIETATAAFNMRSHASHVAWPSVYETRCPATWTRMACAMAACALVATAGRDREARQTGARDVLIQSTGLAGIDRGLRENDPPIEPARARARAAVASSNARQPFDERSYLSGSLIVKFRRRHREHAR